MIMRQKLRLCVVLLMTLTCTTSYAQDGATIKIDGTVDTIEMVAGASQPISFPFPIPKLMVQTPEIIDANPISPSELLITGLKPGVSKLTVVDVNGKPLTLTIEVRIDVRVLQRTMDRQFPQSQIKVSGLQTSVMLSGYVSDSSKIANVLAVANDYFPQSPVINGLQVPKPQNIAIKVKIYEVSRTKLRSVGVDWAYFGDNFNVVTSISDLITSASGGSATAVGQNLTFGVVNDGNNFQAFIQALERHNVAKLLDEPIVVTKDGRPAEFLSGGEIPFQVASGLGNNSIEFRPFGTKLDLVPIVNGDGRMTLEVRAEVSEVDASLSSVSNVPGFRVRRVNVGVDMTAGHTLALAGDYREDLEVEKQGIPKLMDHPFWGAAFRRNREQKNETELVFMITPRFIDEVEASQTPPIGVGRTSVSPSDSEFYLDAHVEVPNCQEDCPTPDGFSAPANTQPGFQPYPIQEAPGGQMVPPVVPGNAIPTPPKTSQRQPYLQGKAGQRYSPELRTADRSTVSGQSSKSGFNYPTK
jgi:pilus assembly protein CpaC